MKFRQYQAALGAAALWLTSTCSSAQTDAVQAVETSPDPEALDSFDIWEYQVEGNTLLPAIDVERAVYGHLGEDRTIDDVTSAQRQLEAAYHSKGYGTVLVDIPEQDVEGGVVRLKVTEAPIRRLSVSGSRYFSLGKIKAGVPSLAVGKAPHLPTVQKELAALANRSRDRVITPVLKPALEPGKLDVDLQVEDELPVHGALEMNDRFSADTTRLRLSASVRYDNLWQRGHSLGASYLVSPESRDEVEVFSANYLWRFERLAHLLSIYAVRSNSDIATVGTLGVIGNGTIAGARYTIPLKALDGYFHTFTLGVDYKEFGESIGLLGNDSVNSPISYAMFNANYNGTWFGEGYLSRLDFTLSAAPRGLGNTDKEFERKRFNADPNFVFATLSVDHERRVWRDFRLFAKAGGQVANSPLINNESYAAGGVNNVRGYLESEKQGDDALNSIFELRYGVPQLPAKDYLRELDLFAFTDVAALRIKDPLPGSVEQAMLWSAGVGFRARGLDSVNAMLLWAMPLRDSDRTEAGDSRLHFNLGYEF